MRYAFLLVSFALLSGPAFAQEDMGSLAERMERLERDMNYVQKQVYRSGSASENGSAASTQMPANSGQLQVRLAQIDEEIRQIRGQIEQVQFQNKQTAAELKKLSDDVDYRLRALEQKAAEAPVAAATTPAPAEGAAPAAATDANKPASYQPAEGAALTGKDFPNANAHYSYALKLLNEKKYAEAASSFDVFVKKYTGDPLLGNAYYWMGESQYARGDFTRATESFRKGFESNPSGQKAPDNLYKLAMSLSQIKRTNEACIVLNQVVTKYGESSARTAFKAAEARTTLQCK